MGSDMQAALGRLRRETLSASHVFNYFLFTRTIKFVEVLDVIA
jgi:hypothetical protein